jgi:formiminotetrahydrofolate cyclodeaminase
MGAALVAMVARITAGNKKFAEKAELANDFIVHADTLREQFMTAREDDETAFKNVMVAMSFPKATDEDKAKRAIALQSALRVAAAEPLHVCELGLELLHLTKQTLELNNRNLVSDVGCAAEFGAACVAAAAHNVRINHNFMSDLEAVENQEHVLVQYERQAALLLAEVRQGVAATLIS